MSQPIIYTLLALALVLPVVGAFVLRLLGERLGERALALGAALLFGLAVASVLALARADARELRVGSLALLLSSPRGSDSFELPPGVVVEGGDPAAAVATAPVPP